MAWFFFFSSRRRHTRSLCDWSSDVCSSACHGNIASCNGMPVCLQFLPVELTFLAQICVVRMWSQHDRIALGGGPADRIWRTDRNPGVRMGLLERFRQDFDILKMPVVFVSGKMLVLPG